MDEAEFWRIISLFDWKKLGDDDAVMKPAIKALARKPVEEIAAFEEILSQKLYALDTRDHARNIGEDAYSEHEKEDEPVFSVDSFLYARCAVVINGPELYYAVLTDPTQFPKDLEFEALLSIADDAYTAKTGEECEGFETTVSYESFSNRAGWVQ